VLVPSGVQVQLLSYALKERDVMEDEVDVELSETLGRWFGFNFCGCGNGDSAMKEFREIFGLFKKTEYGSYLMDFPLREAYEKKVGSGVFYLLMYFLTGNGLLEHGGSVGGSWLTPLGNEVREFLEANPEWVH
jgi:hypothetical protein